ncbi:hypothetical protein [Neopusillimonas aromaticivorans]|uniref:hypothetical protein n=1 Tax=Neopusillimonas aromaticivorans TaxID=2979868 RepID=UPI00259A4578|nr:hypothetical protein [Neopusillimonas aromaticivorans]WJJ93811.1 hypothetical protein N7E01_00635 [Neopusillimonas aromaticivorans]
MASPYASWMDRFRLENPEEVSEVDEGDSLLDALARKGLQHEAAQLEAFRREGKSVVEIANVNAKKPDSQLKAQQALRKAMAQGVDVIFQAMLEQPPFRGWRTSWSRFRGAAIWVIIIMKSGTPNCRLQSSPRMSCSCVVTPTCCNLCRAGVPNLWSLLWGTARSAVCAQTTIFTTTVP